jgi:single-stranded DNA-specific DHH superfamily exonuclease
MRGAEQKRKLVSNSWERYEDIREREKTIGISDYERQWAADFDAFTASGKKSKLLRNDEFCTGGQAAIAAQG